MMEITSKAFTLILTLAGIVFATAMPAMATFPGKNGRIAFLNGPDIYTMNPNGNDVKQLTNLGPDNKALWESWSPNGKQIVFNEYRAPDFLGQLWLMNSDGSNQRALLADTDFDDERPSFTPDGNSVIFSRCRLDIEACALFQIEINGGAVRVVTDFDLGIQDLSPHYATDGKIAFTGVGRDGIICAIELGDSHGASLRRLTLAPLSARQPDWSPDARRIVFSTHCSNPQNEEIWTVAAEGGELSRLTRNGGDYVSGAHDFHPSWSPQGDAIVFERDAPDFSSAGIFIIKPDGSGCAKVHAFGTSPRKSKFQLQPGQKFDRRAERRLKQIEDGGALPQWGAAAN